MLYFVVLLGFLCGGISVASKMLNYQASNYLGTFNGSLINYLLATPISLAVLLLTGGFPAQGFVQAPWWACLGGVFGVLAMVINVYSLHRVNLFQSTTLLLLSQLLTSVVVDLVLFGRMSALKALGVLLLAAGVVWDKRIVSVQQAEEKKAQAM